jgi:coenzyme Q-binding protein COQ10
LAYVERSIVIKGPIDEVYSLARDMEGYPNFMPDVESVKVISKQGDTTVTEWETSVDGTPILWTEKDLFDDANHTITYALIEGDLDKFEGMWRFTSTAEGTCVTLTVDYDFGIPELTNLIGPTLEQKVGENSQMMLEGMKRRIEGL